jgi:hypothetical protein
MTMGCSGPKADRPLPAHPPPSAGEGKVGLDLILDGLERAHAATSSRSAGSLRARRRRTLARSQVGAATRSV